jgi:hypothetical protein
MSGNSGYNSSDEQVQDEESSPSSVHPSAGVLTTPPTTAMTDPHTDFTLHNSQNIPLSSQNASSSDTTSRSGFSTNDITLPLPSQSAVDEIEGMLFVISLGLCLKIIPADLFSLFDATTEHPLQVPNGSTSPFSMSSTIHHPADTNNVADRGHICQRSVASSGDARAEGRSQAATSSGMFNSARSTIINGSVFYLVQGNISHIYSDVSTIHTPSWV